MKKLLSIAFVACATVFNAQTNVYHPMPDSAGKWCEHSVGGTTCAIIDNYTVFMKGDTSFNGLVYHKLYISGMTYCSGFGPPTYYYNQYKGAYRESAKKLYLMKNGGTGNEDLVFDFTLVAGDTLHAGFMGGNGIKVAITSVDSVLIDGTYRKRWWTDQMFSGTTSGNGDQYISVIEGIGSTEGILCEFMCEGVESGNVLDAFTQNDVLLYNKNGSSCSFTAGIRLIEPKLTILPNPATSFVEVTMEEPINNIVIYNSVGEKINATLTRLGENRSRIDLSEVEKGIYIIAVRTTQAVVVKKLVVNR